MVNVACFSCSGGMAAISRAGMVVTTVFLPAARSHSTEIRLCSYSREEDSMLWKINSLVGKIATARSEKASRSRAIRSQASSSGQITTACRCNCPASAAARFALWMGDRPVTSTGVFRFRTLSSMVSYSVKSVISWAIRSMGNTP